MAIMFIKCTVRLGLFQLPQQSVPLRCNLARRISVLLLLLSKALLGLARRMFGATAEVVNLASFLYDLCRCSL